MFKRNRRYTIVALVMLILLSVLSGCQQPKKVNPTLITDDFNGIDLNKLNHYEIEVELDAEEKTYSGKQYITYVNNSKKEFHEIFIHIYPNAFKSKETSPFLFDAFENTYPNGFEPGFIDIKNVNVNKKKVEYNIQGKGDTILKVILNSPLKPNEQAIIYLEYSVKLPPAQDRFGYGNGTFNFGNWYPIVCVYDEDGWNVDPYYSIGDPFYSDISNYKVKITTPKDMIVASSGNILKEKTLKNKKVWEIEGKLIRDFAWVASDNFTVEEGEVEGTRIKMYFLDGSLSIEDFTRKVTEDSITTFNRLFGKYPYGQYSVVATNFPSGMEYPGIVFIGDRYYNENGKENLEKVIVHETAHQWWYGIVGNNEIDEAWLDESLATYSETIYMDEIYGEEVGLKNYREDIEENYKYMKEYYNFEEVALKPLYEFKDWEDYGPLAYQRGAMFLNEIKEDFGREVLYDILNTYFSKYKFLNAKTEDFIKTCEEVTNTSFKERKLKWLYGKIKVED